MTEAGWTSSKATDPLTTIDAKLWADEFMATKARLGEKEFDHAMMLAWFANAIMRGYDEGLKRESADSYAAGRVASCVWKYDDIDDYYETACKNAYCLTTGTLKENDHRYCPYCGGKIEQQAQRGER